MSSVAAAAASTATAVGESEASRALDGCAPTDGSAGPPASPGSGSLARLRESASSFELGGPPDSPSAHAPPEDEESQTTYGSWQEEAPRPVDLARAVSFVAPSESGCCVLDGAAVHALAACEALAVTLQQQRRCLP